MEKRTTQLRGHEEVLWFSVALGVSANEHPRPQVAYQLMKTTLFDSMELFSKILRMRILFFFSPVKRLLDRDLILSLCEVSPAFVPHAVFNFPPWKVASVPFSTFQVLHLLTSLLA